MWVLIIIIWTGSGVDIEFNEFNTIDNCENAAKVIHVEMEGPNPRKERLLGIDAIGKDYSNYIEYRCVKK